jgi:hypothetical protein
MRVLIDSGRRFSNGADGSDGLRGFSSAATGSRVMVAPAHCRDRTMQRWIKLPDGRFVDANRIMYIGKVETYPRIDEDGNDLGQGYNVNIGTDIARDQQLTLMGSKEEVLNVLKQILGTAPAA